jgi:peptidoglycan/LPS O-acetylase OafA/YrhL
MLSRYQALDGLRGVSALMVVFYHFGIDIFDQAGLFENNFIVHTSYAFVDFFFVLSGFVIAHTYWSKLNSLSDFKLYMIKRLARLYPLLLLTVLVFVFFKLYAFYFTDYGFNTPNYGLKQIVIETIEPLTFLNSVPLISTDAGMNPPSWSISAEMISYLIFGLTMLFVKRYKSLIIFIWVGFSFSFLWVHDKYLYTGEWGAIRASLNFGMGVLAYIFRSHFQTKKSFFEYAFLALLIATFYFIDRSRNEMTNLILPFIFTFGVLIFSQERGVLSNLLQSKVAQFLGKISYSIYLNHFIVLWVFYQLMTMLGWDRHSYGLSVLSLVIIFALTILISSFTYEWVELPWGRKIKSWLIRNS